MADLGAVKKSSRQHRLQRFRRNEKFRIRISVERDSCWIFGSLHFLLNCKKRWMLWRRGHVCRRLRRLWVRTLPMCFLVSLINVLSSVVRQWLFGSEISNYMLSSFCWKSSFFNLDKSNYTMSGKFKNKGKTSEIKYVWQVIMCCLAQNYYKC